MDNWQQQISTADQCFLVGQGDRSTHTSGSNGCLDRSHTGSSDQYHVDTGKRRALQESLIALSKPHIRIDRETGNSRSADDGGSELPDLRLKDIKIGSRGEGNKVE